MTKAKPTAQAARLHQLYARLTTVAEQIKQEEARHQAQHRQHERERLMVYGRLVMLAGLDGIPPELLLGMLQECGSQGEDVLLQQRWQTIGAQLLARDRRLQRTVRRLWPHPPQMEHAPEEVSAPLPPLATSARSQIPTTPLLQNHQDGRTPDATT